MFRSLTTLLKFLLDNRRQLPNLRAQMSQDRLVLSFKAAASEDAPPRGTDALLASIEKDIDMFWRTVPFHTIFLNYNLPIKNSRHGGTCSDRAVLFLKQLQLKYSPDLNARLHRAYINDRKTHTVILVTINARDYLIDVGANWPAMRLFPCFEPSSFCAFGIWFRSKPDGRLIKIEMKRPEQEDYRPFLEAELEPQSPELVDEAIDSRHSAQNELPFANGLRFACVDGNAFYFLKEDNLVGDTAHRKDNVVERMFCRLKDFRRIATRYDKRADIFLSAVFLAAAIVWWTN